MLQLHELAVYFRVDTELYATNLDKMKNEFDGGGSPPQLLDAAGSSGGGASAGASAATTAKAAKTLQDYWENDMLIPPISFVAKVSLCKTENDMSRAKVQMNVIIDDVRIIFSRRQYQLIIELLKYFDKYSATQKNRKFRPNVPVKGNARLWWKFALNCVLAEYNEKRLESRRKFWVITKTEKYLSLHERSLVITEKWMSNPTKEQWSELFALEDDPRMGYEGEFFFFFPLFSFFFLFFFFIVLLYLCAIKEDETSVN